ncbi:hypothetical protein [Streptomyces sp. enrichment culture]|uniref:hypothetical protein n=1 Tax=Streptomyces sp. enrichment culture TaxID=1795815 RepID=UPI003F562DF4
MVKYVVCAGSQHEAQAWARLHEIPQRQCLYASSVRKVEGLRDFAVVRLRGFFDRQDRDEIEACLRRNELKRRSPLADRRSDGA